MAPTPTCILDHIHPDPVMQDSSGIILCLLDSSNRQCIPDGKKKNKYETSLYALYRVIHSVSYSSTFFLYLLLITIGSDYSYQASSRSESENISNSDCLFYTPNPGACGSDTFEFRVRSTDTDGSFDGLFDQSATVTVNVFCEGVEPPSTSATQVPPTDSTDKLDITWRKDDRTVRDPEPPVVTTTVPPPPNDPDQDLPDLDVPDVYQLPWWSGKSSKVNDDREACSKITAETSCGTEPKCEWTQYMEGGFMCVPLGATRYGSKSAKYSKAIKASKGGGGTKSSKHMKDFTTCGDIMSPKSCSYSKTYHKCYWNTVSNSCDDIGNVVCSNVYYKKDCIEMTTKGVCYWNGVKDMCEDPPSSGLGAQIDGILQKTLIREVDVIQEPESAQVPESTGHITTGKIISMVSIASYILWSIV